MILFVICACQVSWGEVFSHQKAMVIGCGLMFFQVHLNHCTNIFLNCIILLLNSLQAFTGINSVIFYSTTIFGFAGFDQAILATASVGSKLSHFCTFQFII